MNEDPVKIRTPSSEKSRRANLMNIIKFKNSFGIHEGHIKISSCGTKVWMRAMCLRRKRWGLPENGEKFKGGGNYSLTQEIFI